MKLLKKISIICLAVIAMFSFSMFLGCNDTTDTGNSNSSELQIVTFDKEQVEMIVGDEQYITANVNHATSVIKITYSSSNKAVAEILESGKVIAKSKGSAVITASYGTYKATCKVNVTHGSYLPTLVIDNLEDGELVVPKGVDYALNPYVVFNGKAFDNATFTYTTSNANVSVKNGIVTPNAITDSPTLVTIKAKWDGVSGIASMTKTIKITVTPYIELYINGGKTSEVTIYNQELATLSGTTPMDSDFVITAYDENKNPLTPTVTISDPSIAEYVDGKIEGKGVLTTVPATITVSVPVGSDTYKLYVKLNCLRAVGDYMTQDKSAYKTVDFDTLIGSIDVEGIFGYQTTLESAKHGREDLVVENGKIASGIEGSAFTTPDPIVVTLYDDTTGYNVEILPYVYKNAQELQDSYNISAHDGEFFDGDFNHKTVKELFGADLTIKKAYLRTADGQQELAVSEDGLRIQGLGDIKNIQEQYIALGSEQSMVYVSATAYTLILDEMQDFNYFYVSDGTWSYKPNVFNVVAGLDWDGYYVLANDIDASTYEFKGLQNGFRYLTWGTTDTYSNATFGTLGANYWESKGPATMGLEGRGLQGIFDGRGHTISNYTPLSGGLFQFINGGIVRNVGFENASVGRYEGVLCSTAFNNASIENVFVQINPAKSYGTVYAGSSMIGSIGSSVKFKNVVVVNEGTSIPTGDFAGAIASYNNSTQFGSAMENVYVVSPQPLQFTNSSGIVRVDKEAKYVDGVEITDKTIVSVPGIRRYSSFDKFYQDVVNVNSSAFDTSIWSLLSGSIPVMTSSIKDENLEIFVGDAKANEAASAVTLEENTPITLRYGGLIYDYVDSISIGSGSENVSTNGYNVYGKKMGEATLTATYNRDGRIITREFSVLALHELTTFETEYYFSAQTGEFFTMDDASNELTVVNDPLNVLFGKTTSGSDLFAAYDKTGNPLDITSEPGKILGLQTISDGYLDTFIDIYSQDAGVKVIVKACDLIIDEASDFEFFKIKKDAINHQGPSLYRYEFAADDFAWDGYYVLAKDIDASEYGIHDLDNKKVTVYKSGTYNENDLGKSSIRSYKGSRLEFLGNSGIKAGSFIHGLLGTFDGRGYVISNLTTTKSGLFGVIAGEGTVKNVGFIDCKVDNHAGGFLAWAITGGGKLQDVYATTDNSNIGSDYSPLVSTWGQSSKADNVIIEDNTLLKTNSTSSSYAYGSLSYSNINDSRGTPRPQLQFKKDYLNNFFIISDKPLQATVPANVLGNDLANHTVGLEAQFVDGVEYANANIIALGIKRYTSTANMRLDTTNDYTSFNSEVWTFVNGAPKFIRALDKAVSVYFGEQEVKNGEIEVLKGQQYPVTLRIDGVAVDLKDIGGNITVALESGNSVSVTDNVISAVAVSNTPSIVKISNSKFSFSVVIDVVLEVNTHDEELYLSAEEGILFDANFNPVSVASIFDANSVELIKVYDAFGGLLTVGEDNTILGAATSSTGYFETYVILYTAEKAIKVDVKVAQLIIDEKEDFAYFTIKKAWDYGTTKANAYTFADDDFVWEGYYVLAKNIDATGYTHNVILPGLGNKTNLRTHTGSQMDHLAHNGIKSNQNKPHGFLGTFDGQGYAISNLTTTDGLLGALQGAVIKNVAFIGCSYSPLATVAFGNTSLENIFVSTPSDKISPDKTPLITSISCTTRNVSNVVIYDNSSDYGSYGSGYGDGSWDYNTRRYNAKQAYTFGQNNTTESTLDNVILVSDKAMSRSWAANATTWTEMMDAEYIDGVLNTKTYNINYAGTTTAVGPVKGVYRYSSQLTLSNDVTNLTAKFKQLTDTGYFTVSDTGVISWAKAN